MRSNPAHHLFFIFELENILRSKLLLVSFIWLGEKISLKYLLPDGVDVCPPKVQIVSTSLMSKLVKGKILLELDKPDPNVIYLDPI